MLQLDIVGQENGKNGTCGVRNNNAHMAAMGKALTGAGGRCGTHMPEKPPSKYSLVRDHGSKMRVSCVAMRARGWCGGP